MPGRIKVIFICVLEVVMSACVNNPVFTAEVYKTATPEGSASPGSQSAIPPVPTSTPIVEHPSPSTSAVKTRMPPDFSPILYGKKYDANTFFLLLGAVQGNTWLASEQSAAQFGGEWEYDVYTWANRTFPVRGRTPEFSPTSSSYFLGTDVNFDDFGMVGVLHDWTVRQGDVQELSADNEMYKQIILDWLESQGVASPRIGIMHIFRVDLEADGVDEIFISSTHLDGSQHLTKAGDHSIVLMRKVVENEAVTLPLVTDVYHSQQAEITFPATYSLGNFIDLNRDGVLEVVVDMQRWEGFGAIVYQVDGQAVTEVMR
jgi:hypothetical protein